MFPFLLFDTLHNIFHSFKAEHFFVLAQIILIPLIRSYVQKINDVSKLEVKNDIDKKIEALKDEIHDLITFIESTEEVSKVKRSLANDRLNRILKEFYCDDDYSINKTEYKLFDD